MTKERHGYGMHAKWSAEHVQFPRLLIRCMYDRTPNPCATSMLPLISMLFTYRM